MSTSNCNTAGYALPKSLERRVMRRLTRKEAVQVTRLWKGPERVPAVVFVCRQPTLWDTDPERAKEVAGEAVSDLSLIGVPDRERDPTARLEFDARLARKRRASWRKYLQRVDTDDPQTLARACVIVQPRPNPVWISRLLRAGAFTVGTSVRTISLTEWADSAYTGSATQEALLAATWGQCLYGERSHAENLGRGGRAAEIGKAFSSEHTRWFSFHDQPKYGVLARHRVVAQKTPGGGLHARLMTVPGYWLEEGGPVDLWQTKGTRRPYPIYPDEAIELVHRMREDGQIVCDPDGFVGRLEALVRRCSVVRSIAGSPGLCLLADGEEDRDLPATQTQTVSAAHAGRILERRRAEGREIVASGRVLDAVATAQAKPSPNLVALPPQREVIARMDASDYGVLNASGTGSGKTVMAALALREKARRYDEMRVLVVCEGSVKTQWSEEMADDRHGFLEARVVALSSESRPAGQVAQADAQAKGSHLVVVATKDQMRKYRDDFALEGGWDVLVLDEGGYVSGGSQAAKAAVSLREKARVCWVLDATPLNRSVREMAGLMAVVLGEERRVLQTGTRQLDELDSGALRRLMRGYGDYVQRITRADLREHMPAPQPDHYRYDPTPAEEALHRALNERAVELYERLAEMAEERRVADPENPVLGKLRDAALRYDAELRGVCDFSVMVATEPKAAVTSARRIALAIRAEGLLAPVLRQGPTKRLAVARALAGACGEGEQAIVFSRWRETLRALGETLRHDHGIVPGAYNGDTTPKDRDRLREAFQEGRVPVLLVSDQTGMRGLNLQAASSVVHYDCPWTPRTLEQRVGRCVRVGSRHEEVQVLFPTLRGSAEEHLVEILVPRAASGYMALDGSRGLSASESDIGGQLTSLAWELGKEDAAKQHMRLAATLLAARER